MKKLLFAMTLAACGSSSPATIDAPGTTAHDAPNTTAIDAPASNIPAMITITGIASTVSTSGKTPTAGVMIVAKKISDDSMIAMATSGADGSFTLTAATGGVAVDAYLLATKTGLIDTYLYPAAPLSADYAGIPVFQVTTSTQNLANQIGGADPQTATQAWVGAVVQDATQTAVAGAVFTATPAGGMIHYNSSGGLPQAQATSTAADGTAYYMNAPAGMITVGATKTGSTFHSHVINARAAKVTLTLVQP